MAMHRRARSSVWVGALSLVWLAMPVGCSDPSSPSASTSGHGGDSGSGGSSARGGSGGSGSGGASAHGGSSGRGGQSGSGPSGGTSGASSGGASGSGGSAAGGKAGGSGGQPAGAGGGAGGAGNAGAKGTGGATGAGGVGAGGSGGRTTPSTGSGGSAGSSGGSAGSSAGTGGAAAGGSGGGSSTDCTVTISTSSTSTAIPTVGIVEWSTSLSNPTSAKVVYALNNPGSNLNQGGSAPVDLSKTNYRTLLLGLKPSSTYTYHVEATSAAGTCKSADKTLTTAAAPSGWPTVTRTATTPTAQAGGFIVTSSGQGGGGFGGGGSNYAFIVDADGTVVWAASAPSQCSRAHMDYEGANMWMVALNVQNSGGEMRFVSMDGTTSKNNISGLSSAHHDFTVLPGKIAAMVWAASGTDPESNLVEMNADGSGSPTTAFKIGSNLYAGGSSAFGGTSTNTYHCNYIIYHPGDDSFTISDRNPNLVVKAKHDGTPVWQIGGSCASAKAPKCATGTWQVNHGHDLDGDGNMLLFNNGQSGSSHVFDFKLTESSSAISYTTTKDFTSGNSSNVLGDVQFLPNGSFLVTYSTGGVILEVDSSWKTVQTLKGGFGYADWRETLYGAPTRQ